MLILKTNFVDGTITTNFVQLIRAQIELSRDKSLSNVGGVGFTLTGHGGVYVMYYAYDT